MSLLLPETLRRPFKGVLFDLDGTLVDSEEFHFSAFAQAMREYGYDITTLGDDIPLAGTLSFRALFTAIAQKMRLDETLFEAVYQRKVDITLTVADHDIEIIDGVMSYLELLSEHNVPLGIVTNAEQAYVDHILGVHGLSSFFQHIVSADTAPAMKPEPGGYVYGASLLGLPPADIIVFENTDGGILAAKQAGMPVIALRTTDHLGHSTYEQADHTIDTFSDNSIDDLQFNTTA